MSEDQAIASVEIKHLDTIIEYINDYKKELVMDGRQEENPVQVNCRKRLAEGFENWDIDFGEGW